MECLELAIKLAGAYIQITQSNRPRSREIPESSSVHSNQIFDPWPDTNELWEDIYPAWSISHDLLTQSASDLLRPLAFLHLDHSLQKIFKRVAVEPNDF